MGGCQSRRDVTGLWRCHGEWFIDVYQEWIDQRATGWQAINPPSNQRWQLSIKALLRPLVRRLQNNLWVFPRNGEEGKNRKEKKVGFLWSTVFAQTAQKQRRRASKRVMTVSWHPSPFFLSFFIDLVFMESISTPYEERERCERESNQKTYSRLRFSCMRTDQSTKTTRGR